MTRRTIGALRPLAALAVVALAAAGCAENSGERAGTGTGAAPPARSADGAAAKTGVRARAVRFSQCMRDHGVTEFPDPDASGSLTIDGVVNGSSLDPGSAAFKQAIVACRDLQPAGFTGTRRSAEQQESALRFARCMRDNGIGDFPDPAPGDPLVDTSRIPSAAGRGARSIPGFQAAMQTCGTTFSDALGLRAP